MEDPWVEVALEEYRTLRQESLAAIEQIQRTLQIGLVAIGVITGFGAQVAGPAKNATGVAVGIGLVLAPPILAALISVLCLEELRRAVEAGIHVARLEGEVATRLRAGRSRPLEWETKTRREHSNTKGFRTHWWRTAALFGAGIPAVGLGVASLVGGQKYLPLWLSGGGAVLLCIAAVSFQCWSHRKLAKTARDAMEPRNLAADSRSVSSTGVALLVMIAALLLQRRHHEPNEAQGTAEPRTSRPWAAES